MKLQEVIGKFQEKYKEFQFLISLQYPLTVR